MILGLGQSGRPIGVLSFSSFFDAFLITCRATLGAILSDAKTIKSLHITEVKKFILWGFLEPFPAAFPAEI